MVIGVLVTLLAVCGILMWVMPPVDVEWALISVVFVFVGTPLSIGALVRWNRIIVVAIGCIVTLLAVFGSIMWGVSKQNALVALSAVFVFVGVALSIGALVWPASRGRQEGHKK